MTEVMILQNDNDDDEDLLTENTFKENEAFKCTEENNWYLLALIQIN